MSRSLAALVVLAVGAAALSPFSCSLQTLDFEASLTASCYRVNTVNNAVDVTVVIPRRSVAGNSAEVFVWNINDNAGFVAPTAVTFPAATVAPTTPTAPSGNTLATVFTVDLTQAALDVAQDITITITIPMTADTTLEYGLTASVVSTSATSGLTVTNTQAAQVNLRLDQASSLAVTVENDFARLGYIVDSVTFTFSGAEAAGLATVTAAPELMAVSVAAPVVTGNVAAITYTEVAAPTAPLVLNFPLTLTDFDLATQGPFVSGFIDVAVVEYPVLAGDGTFFVPEGTTSTWRVELPLLWTGITARTDAGSGTVYTLEVSMNPATAADITTAPVAPMAPRMYSVTPGGGLSSYELLAPLESATPVFVFVQAVVTTGVMTVFVDVEAVPGECSSYVDCRDDGVGATPTLRAQRSANDDTRFLHCALVPSIDDPSAASTTCIECLTDCDCGAGQYCHQDDGGVCEGEVCDTDSRTSLGLCLAKDPTGDILGESCRQTGGTPALIDATTGFTMGYKASISSPADLPLIEGPAVQDILTDGGVGFCGRAAYYPASDTGAVNGAARANGARAILWEGACYNGICHECLGESTACAGAQQCIDGSLMDTIVVDGTARTFSNNVEAGVGLGIIFMVILLQCCVCCRIYQARKYRKQDRMEDGKDKKAATVFQ